MPIALCANKIDKKRQVSEEEGRQYATSRGLQYFETSASSGDNVQDMFNYLFQVSLRKMMATNTN
jgi:DnaJ homolog subfamily C member 27